MEGYLFAHGHQIRCALCSIRVTARDEFESVAMWRGAMHELDKRKKARTKKNEKA
jgi:hypothetical protein